MTEPRGSEATRPAGMRVHNHGSEEGGGYACREWVIDGRFIVGDCLLPEGLRAREAERGGQRIDYWYSRHYEMLREIERLEALRIPPAYEARLVDTLGRTLGKITNIGDADAAERVEEMKCTRCGRWHSGFATDDSPTVVCNAASFLGGEMTGVDDLRRAFYAGARFREVTLSVSGDDFIKYEAERRYPASQPVERLARWTCFGCGHENYGAFLYVAASGEYVPDPAPKCRECGTWRGGPNADRAVCTHCGTDSLVTMDSHEYGEPFYHDYPTVHPLRCQHITIPANAPDHPMRCYKRAGHDGAHSTHNDCGAQNAEAWNCGKEPGHAGPHGWEERNDGSTPTGRRPSSTENA